MKLTRDIAIYGIQGSGKTTQGKILADKTGATFFYFGQELRNRIAIGDGFARKLNSIQSKGLSQPPENLEIIINDFFHRHPTTENFIYDTPARIRSQKPLFDRIIKEKNRQIIIILLKLNEKISRQRIQGQKSRNDSSPEAINQRIKLFFEETIPVIEAYRQEGIPVIEIDASPPIETIAQNIEQSLFPYLIK